MENDGFLNGSSLCATTNMWVCLWGVFNACQMCAEMRATALPDSLGDALAFGSAGCEGAV